MCPSILAWLALGVVYGGTSLTTAEPKTLTRQTAAGAVRGRVGSTGLLEWHGIPFASPPVGFLRWKIPLPLEPYDGVFDATNPDAPKCPQNAVPPATGIVGQEDCLVLSVYSPAHCTPSTPCPVMQWIYGGAWSIGSEDHYNGTQLANHGVVVVVANYRLDALGWLALQEMGQESQETPTDTLRRYGNYGLYDQTLSMRWTAANIHVFGGDPSQVTLFGESAGAFSVCQHLVMPMSNKLFNKAIISSGSCDGPYGIGVKHNARRFATHYAGTIGCPVDPSGNFTARMACLRALPIDKVILPRTSWNCKDLEPNTSPWCADYDSKVISGLGIVPPVAPVAGFFAAIYTDSLPGEPLGELRKRVPNTGPNGEKIKVMLGHNQDEMAPFILFLPKIVPQIDSVLPVTNLSFSKVVEHFGAYNDNWNASVGQALELVYPSSAGTQEAYRLNQFGTDILFRCPTRRAARLLAATGVEVYHYNFNFHFDGYKDPNSLLCEFWSEVGCGVYHASDVKYVFSQGVPETLQDQAVATLMSNYWTNFARFGTPNMPNVPKWPLYTAATQYQHLEFTPTGTAEPSYEQRGAACDALDALAGFTM